MLKKQTVISLVTYNLYRISYLCSWTKMVRLMTSMHKAVSIVILSFARLQHWLLSCRHVCVEESPAVGNL